MAKKQTKSKTKAKAPSRPKAGTSKASAEQRRAIFIECYIANGENGEDAAIKAGFSPKTAAQQASRLLKDVKVQAALEKRRAVLRQKFEITPERVLQELARMSFSDARKFFNANGSPKPISELDDDTAAVLVGMEVLEEYEGTGKDRKFIGYTKKYKLADKNSAIEKAMKHLGMFLKDREQLGAAIGKAIIVPAKGARPAS